MPSSSTRRPSKEWSRKYQRFFASQEQFLLRSSRLVDPLPELSSRNSARRILSSQSEFNTILSISTREPRPRLLPRSWLQKRLKPSLPRRRRRVKSDQTHVENCKCHDRYIRIYHIQYKDLQANWHLFLVKHNTLSTHTNCSFIFFISRACSLLFYNFYQFL